MFTSEPNSNLGNAFTGNARVISYGNALSCFTDINTKQYKKMTITISSYSGLSNVKFTNGSTVLGTYTANGTHTIDVSNYDSIRLASTGQSNVYNGTAVVSYTLSA